MKRRELLRGAGLAAVATGLAACGARPEGAADGGVTASTERLQWKMVTSWPTNFPGLGTGAARLAAMITAASGGRLTIKVYGAGELVPAFEVFDAVGRGRITPAEWRSLMSRYAADEVPDYQMAALAMAMDRSLTMQSSGRMVENHCRVAGSWFAIHSRQRGPSR